MILKGLPYVLCTYCRRSTTMNENGDIQWWVIWDFGNVLLNKFAKVLSATLELYAMSRYGKNRKMPPPLSFKIHIAHPRVVELCNIKIFSWISSLFKFVNCFTSEVFRLVPVIVKIVKNMEVKTYIFTFIVN